MENRSETRMKIYFMLVVLLLLGILKSKTTFTIDVVPKKMLLFAIIFFFFSWTNTIKHVVLTIVTDGYGPERMNPTNLGDFSSSSSSIRFVSTIVWIVKCQSGSDVPVHGPPRINCNSFGDSITFHLVPASGQITC